MSYSYNRRKKNKRLARKKHKPNCYLNMVEDYVSQKHCDCGRFKAATELRRMK